MNNKYYPMNSAEVLDQTMEIYKKSFLKQVGISLIFSIIFMVALYIFIFAGLIGGAVMAFGTFAQGALGPGGFFAIAVFILLFMLIVSMYGALASTGNALITKKTFLGEHCDLGKMISESFKKIWRATSAVIANLIALLPVIIVLGVLIFLYVLMLVAFADAGAGVMTMVILSIILILIVVTFMVLYITLTMLSVSVAIFESKWFFGALARGFSLAQPDFFKLMGIVAVWFSVMTALSYSVSTFFDFGSFLVMSFLPSESAVFISLIMTVVGVLVSMVVSVLLAPLSGIFYTVVYMNQRIKHEGLDIELNLNANSNALRSHRQ